MGKFVRHYQNLLGSKVDKMEVNGDIMHAGSRIMDTDFEGLLSLILLEEVKDTFFDIDNDKAPRSDGCGSLFLKYTWDTVFGHLFSTVNEFFISGRMLRQWNHSIIAFVPKSSSACSVNGYRPICCCIMLYKIISKVLDNRLRRVIGVVDGAQVAFIEGGRL